jgi:large subunit ribosomal protein L25
MSEAIIEVQRRELTGKGPNRRLRGEGIVPAVLYGSDREPVAIQISRRTLLELFKGAGHENRIFLLKLAGTDQTRHAMVRDLQLDPTTSQVVHVDFQRIAMDKKLRVRVHLQLEGIPYGVKTEGGFLDFVTREVEVECLPGKIPAALKIDVTPLHAGQHVEARELVLPEGIEVVASPDTVLVSVKHARVEEPEPEAAAVEPAAEPEVLQRGRKEDEAQES